MRTVVFSKSWLNAFRTRPHIHLDQRLFLIPSPSCADYANRLGLDEEERKDLDVKRFLKYVRATIRPYFDEDLLIEGISLVIAEHFVGREVIKAAVRLQAEYLSVRTINVNESFTIPHVDLDHPSVMLQDLHFVGCCLEGKFHLPDLRELHLSRVQFKGDLLSDIISSSNTLQTLHLDECIIPRDFQISSTSLEYILLDIIQHGTLRVEFVLPKIRKLSLSLVPKYRNYPGVPSLVFKGALAADWESEIFFQQKYLKQYMLASLSHFLAYLVGCGSTIANLAIKFQSVETAERRVLSIQQ